MSRVKQSLEEAKEFAATNNGADDVPEITIPDPPVGASTFVLDGDGNPVAYKFEQDLVNIRLRAAVVAVEDDAVKLSGTFIDRTKELKKLADDTNARRNPAASEYRRLFLWPPVDDTALSSIHDELSLSVAVEELMRCSSAVDEVAKSASPCGSLLVELLKLVPLLRRKNDISAELQALHATLLQDQSITQDLIIELHDLAQGDVFAFLRSQIAPMQRALENIRDDFARTVQAKQDAEAVDDMQGIERSSYRLIDLASEIISKIDQRLREIFTADADVKAFSEKYDEVRGAAEQTLNAHESAAKERATKLLSDLELVSKARVAKEAEDARVSDQHLKRMENVNAEIVSTNQKQSAAWDTIFQQFEILKDLTTQRQDLVTKQIQYHAEECQRSAHVEAWLRGAESYVEHCKRSNDFTSAQLSWISQLRSYVDKMCGAIENKNVDEEAWNIRVQEQLDYLDAYKEFKLRSNEVIHRKDLRVQSLQRLSRNLQLQIQEATLVLDPNKKRYESELDTIAGEIADLGKQIEALTERNKAQQKEWKVVEEQLEDAQVDFTPPDITVEREMCDRKAQALSVVRAFVSAEQETVDKDTMKLRKLRTNNQVSIEGFNKRRDERHKQIEDGAAAAASGGVLLDSIVSPAAQPDDGGAASAHRLSPPPAAHVTFPDM